MIVFLFIMLHCFSIPILKLIYNVTLILYSYIKT